MANALIKISKRAKQLRKSSPGMSQTTAIKKASLEYRQGKLGSSMRQTGTSNKKRDKERSARKPGKRVIKKGRKKSIYYERRKNRSDKPGSMTGTDSSYNHVLLGYINNYNTQLGQAELRMKGLKNGLKNKHIPRSDKVTIRKNIKAQRKVISQLKSNIRMTKRLLK